LAFVLIASDPWDKIAGMEPRSLSAQEAAELVRPVDTIGLGLGPANPHHFLGALSDREDFEDLTIAGALVLGLFGIFTKPGVHYRSGFFGPGERYYASVGANIGFVPAGFRQFGPILVQLNPRIMAAQATKPNEDGLVSLSLHLGATYDELLAAGRDPNRLLIVETSPHLPWTYPLEGYSNTIPVELIDVLIEEEARPFELAEPPTSEVDEAIARNALGLIADGSTLQTGIGSIPSIVATRLAERAGGSYGIHSEMLTDGIMRLYQAGKVHNDAKGCFDGVSVTTFALGSAELYAWLDQNRDVAFAPVTVVNDPSVIAKNRSFVSINGAICVDLLGQIVADNIDGRQISGVGGHEDFVSGAELRLDDRSLVCLSSTVEVAGETRSRILPSLPEGAVVSTPRHHTGVIATEHGAADLTGMTVRERAHALLEVAHPDFRAELRAAADRLGR
jgi:acyl-CoA hydrolase